MSLPAFVAVMVLLVVTGAFGDDGCCCDCACNCDNSSDDSNSSDPDFTTTTTPPKPAHRLAMQLAWALGVVVVLAIVVRSQANASAPATPAPTAEVVSPMPVIPVGGAEVPTADPPPAQVAEIDVAPALPVADEPAPLLAVNVAENSPPLSAVIAPEPAVLPPAVFGLGSSREDVIAAQGGPPTYSARHGKMLWWGSSRVEFDEAGGVRAWLNGTPALRVRPREPR